MNNIWNKFKIYIIIILALVLVSFVVWMVAIPLLQMIKNQTSEIQKKSIEQQDKQQRLGEIGTLKKQHDFLMSEKENMKLFVTRETAVEAIELIERISKETENEIIIDISDSFDQAKNLKKAPGSSGDKKSIVYNLPKKEYIKMDIRLMGSYEALFNFLKKVESMKYLGDIISISTQVEDPILDTEVNNKKEDEAEIPGFRADKSIRHLSTKLSIVFYVID